MRLSRGSAGKFMGRMLAIFSMASVLVVVVARGTTPGIQAKLDTLVRPLFTQVGRLVLRIVPAPANTSVAIGLKPKVDAGSTGQVKGVADDQTGSVLGESLGNEQLMFRIRTQFRELVTAQDIEAAKITVASLSAQLIETDQFTVDTLTSNQLITQTATIEQELTVNGPTALASTLDVSGESTLTGPVTLGNTLKLGGDVTGSGVTIDVGDGEVLASNLVYSLQGEVGELELTAGDGITIDGLTISNDDGGTLQSIFKKIAVSGQDTIEADDNVDTLTLAGTSGITITTDAGSDTLTISASTSDLNVSGWEDLGTDVVLQTLSDSVGIGTSAPSSKLHVVGNALIDGDLSVTGNTTVLSGFNNSGGGITNAGAITGATGFTSSGTITLSGLSTGVVQSNFNGILSSSALNLAGGSSYITGTLPVANGGTSITSYTAGDILYATDANTLTKLGIGGDGEVLTVAGGVPDWATASGSGPCATCLVNNPGSTQTITPSLATATGLSVRQASGGSVDIFNVTNSDGSIKYLRVDSSGNVQLGTNGATTTGNFTVSPSSTDPISIAPVAMGSAAYTGTITSEDLTAARTWTFPDSTGVVCLTTGNCSGTSAGLGGSGGNNYVAKWNGTYSLTNSLLYDNGTNVGIGTTVTSAKLHVAGTGYFSSDFTADGAAILNDTLDVGGPAGFTSTLSVDGTADFNSTLGVSGATTLSSTLNVTGLTTLSGNLNVNGTGNSYAMGNWGIGTSSPLTKLHVAGSGTAVNASGSAPQDALIEGASNAVTSTTANLQVVSNSSIAADAGGSIGFGGKYSGNSYAQFAAIKSGKTNSSGGDYSGYLAFATRLTGGTPLERMRIDNVGNVGIGTTSPGALLHVKYTNNELKFGGNSLEVTTDNSSSPALKITGTGTADLLNIFDNATEVFTILDGGNVGIGTTNPARKLKVAGTAEFTGDTWVGGILALGTTQDAGLAKFGSQGIGFRVGDTADKIVFNDSGNVGIGTTNPSEMLHLYSNTTDSEIIVQTDISTGDARLHLRAYNNAASRIYLGDNNDNDIGAIYYLHASDAMTFTTNNAEQLRITSVGNVGVGTTSTVGKLQVYSTTAGSPTSLSGSTYSVGGSTLGSFGASTHVGLVGAAYYNNQAVLGSNPLGTAYATAGLVGIGAGTSGSVHALGVAGFGQAVTSSTGFVAGGKFQADTSGDLNAGDTLYGVYSRAYGTTNTVGSDTVYGVYGYATGQGTDTTYAGYFSGGGGTTNYGIYSAAGWNYFNSNVGINSASPAYPLDVVGGAHISGSLLVGTGATLQYSSSRAELVSGSGGSIALYTDAAERVRIDTLGNVGIGTTGPGQKLTVVGGSTTPLGLTKSAAGQWISFADGTDTWGLYNHAGTPEGNVTADTGALAVDTTVGQLYIKTDDGDATNWSSLATGGASQWTDAGAYIYANNGTSTVVDDSGNIGIGTTSPGSALDVAGRINIAAGNSLSVAGTNVLKVSNTATGTWFFGNGGASHGSNDTYNLSVGLGALTGLNNSGGTYNVALGYNTLAANTTADKNIAIGYNALAATQTGGNNIVIGYTAAQSTTGTIDSIIIGNDVLQTGATQNSVIIGNGAVYNNNWNGNGQVIVGYGAGRNIRYGGNNVMLGRDAGNSNNDGGSNTYVGYGSAYRFDNGSYNTFLGAGSGNGQGSAVSSSSNNTLIGYEAGYNIGNSASRNTALGVSAGRLMTNNSSGNLFLGYAAGYNETGSDKLYIETGGTSLTSTNSLIYGDFSTDTLTFNANVGIGTTAPLSKLSINGNLYANTATISATYAGGKGLVVLGGPSGTANIIEAQNSSATPLLTVGSGGALAIEGQLSDISNGTLDINDDLQVSGNDILSSSGSIAITLNNTSVRVAGALSSTGNFSSDGDTTLGSATNDDITFTGRAASSLIPKTSATYDLGSSTLRWANIYASTSVALPDTGLLRFGSNGDCTNDFCIDDSDIDTPYDYTITNHNTGSLYLMPDSNVGIGTTSTAAKLDVLTNTASGYAAKFFNDGNNANRNGILIQSGLDDHTAAGPSTLVQFNDGNGGAVGSITFGSSLTAYNTTSDQRAKQNITPSTLGIDQLMNIKIRDFSFIADPGNKIHTGFIAQELYEVFPDAVTAFTDDRYWQVDYGKVTPLIIKSVQDQQSQIAQLQQTQLAFTTEGLLTSEDQAQVLGAVDELSHDLTGISALVQTLQHGLDNILTDIAWLKTAVGNLQQLFTFSSDTVTVTKDVVFSGREESSDSDRAGWVVVPAGQTSAAVKFDKAYKQRPVITATPEGATEGYYLEAVSENGFTLVLKQPLGSDVTFNWTAILVKDARTTKDGNVTGTSGGTSGGSSAPANQDPPVASPSPAASSSASPTPAASPEPIPTPTSSPDASSAPSPTPEPAVSPAP